MEDVGYAAQLFPVAAEYRTPADLMALSVLAIRLYYAAVNRVSGGTGYRPPASPYRPALR